MGTFPTKRGLCTQVRQNPRKGVCTNCVHVGACVDVVMCVPMRVYCVHVGAWVDVVMCVRMRCVSGLLAAVALDDIERGERK